MKKFILALMAIIAFAAASPGSASAAVTVHSNYNGWDAQGSDLTMIANGDTYTVDVQNAPENFEFVINDNGTEYKALSKPVVVVLGTEYDTQVTSANDYNFKVTNAGSYTITYTKSNHKVKVTEIGSSSDDNFAVYYIVGNNSSWAFEDSWKMETTDGNIYTFDCSTKTINAGEGFQISQKEWKGQVTTDNKQMEDDNVYDMVNGGSGKDMAFKANFSGKISYNVSEKTLTIGNLGGDITDPDDPTPLTGTFSVKTSQNGWNDNSSMSNDGNVWTCYGKDFTAGDQFVIVNTATNPATEYKSEFEDKNGTKIELNTPTKAVINGNDHNYKIETTGKYDVIFDARDKNNLTVTIKQSVGGSDHSQDKPFAQHATKKVYFNAGLDYDRATKIGGSTLYAHFIKKGSNDPVPHEYCVKMTDNRTVDGANALLPLFFAPVPENYTDFDGVQFEVEGSDLVYNSKKCDNTSKYDYDHAFDYIFSAETQVEENGDPNLCRAEQSYVTFEDYRARRDGDKIAVYYCGSNIKGRDGLNASSDWYATDFYGKVGISQRSEDVFMFQVTPISNGEEIKFKMSWIDANGRADVYNALNQTSEKVSGGDQRWWATFNLGLVGPTLAPQYGDDMAAAYPHDCTVASNVGDNGAIAYTVDRVRKYSRYNSFDWWIKADKVQEGTLVVVVDTYYKTTALVSFEPRPTVYDIDLHSPTNYTGEITEAQAIEFGKKFHGHKTHGDTKIDKANTVGGDAIINASDNISFWTETEDKKPQYYLDYGLYYIETANTEENVESSEDNLLTTFRGVKDAKSYIASVENLPVGKEDAIKIGVRCTYTDNVNSAYDGYVAKFRSFTNWQDAKLEATLPSPTLSVDDNVAFRLDDNKWHAHVTGTLNVANANDENSLNFFFDVDSIQPSNSVHLAEQSEFQCQNGIGSHHYVNADNNWATVRDDNKVYFVIEDIDMNGDKPLKKAYQSNFRLQVPFITGDLNPDVVWCDQANGQGSQKPLEQAAQAPRRRASAYANPRTDMVLVSVPFSSDTNVGENLSGIADAAVEAGAPAEYFNMQGVRVEGEITPGVYIVRRGDKVTKEIVR